MHLEKNIDSIAQYLHSQDFLHLGESIETLEIPGDGNMNFTLRVITGSRNFIIKQSRPFVEKYPQVAAPADRCQREAEFYQLISKNELLSEMTPAILHVDGDNNIMIMSDLGAGSDFARLYNRPGAIEQDEMDDIVRFIGTLHTTISADSADFIIENKAMRKLNYEHMYVYPFMEENGFNLDDIQPGLQELSMQYKQNESLKKHIENIGERYLANGDVLLHGDYFPGSWLKTSDGIKIIDPEFCFFGYPEFELGIMQAHLILCRQDNELIESAFNTYKEYAEYNVGLVQQAAGVEILRRLLGLAQLPVNHSLSEKEELLQLAHSMIINQNSLS